MSFHVYGGRQHQSGHPYGAHNQDGVATRVYIGERIDEADPARSDFIAAKLARLRGVNKETVLREFAAFDRRDQQDQTEERRIA